MTKKFGKAFVLIIFCISVFACAKTEKTEDVFKIAIFVPGKVKGNPTYEMLIAGVEEAKDICISEKKNIDIKVVEGGFNQGAWKDGLMSLALTKEYNLIISSNPSLPALAEEVLKVVPEQKFLLMDGYLEGNKNIKTVSFNQYQQAYINGYFAAMVSTSKMEDANADLKIGLLAGQEFPVMNNDIRVGFLDGAKAVNENFELDFRVLGNWFDAAKAAQITKSMIQNGCDVILTICGGGNAGVVSACRENGAYVSWYDNVGYSYGKDIVVGSSILKFKKACKLAVFAAVNGSIKYGKPTVFGIKDGAVDFAFEGLPKSVPEEIIKKEKALIQSIKKNGLKRQ